ncbi:hypothetical protein [Nocardia australiensis]|uniref:hypothetical protein n=1 Tax=Nocardia australiensis TaxID=2887191 RepID=UPI001D13E3D6|nr:hypothetical protein [Nocardia australiensis]
MNALIPLEPDHQNQADPDQATTFADYLTDPGPLDTDTAIPAMSRHHAVHHNACPCTGR